MFQKKNNSLIFFKFNNKLNLLKTKRKKILKIILKKQNKTFIYSKNKINKFKL
jgi:hypothetical protein